MKVAIRTPLGAIVLCDFPLTNHQLRIAAAGHARRAPTLRRPDQRLMLHAETGCFMLTGPDFSNVDWIDVTGDLEYETMYYQNMYPEDLS